MAVLHSAPKYAPNDGVRETLAAALGAMVLDTKEEFEEIIITVQRERIEDALRLLRDEHHYQMLMEIAGADYPSRAERFEVIYMLLSITKNHRVMVKVSAAEDTPVPTVTTLWPVAGWLEREIFDLFGVIFAGNRDLRRILTDYGFEGHPFRKDFPLTGYVEVRYSEEDKRVVYEPVRLDQDLRTFDFLSPWEGADYELPGDEKAKPAPSPVAEVKVTESPEETGAGEKTDAKAAEKVAPSVAATGTVAGQGQSEPTPITSDIPDPGAPKPTADRPDRPPSGGASADEGTGSTPEGS
ncbi:NADH-quinone oxidoreductase subunit C [Novosphingobium sp. RD2P27]|uniref:NADH-quinone oxidoreductase subunit C n=1 Tax=Novosphingobium kalidii TaxID=3230299 RepID=A0ABV2D2Y8_9SPHN